MFFTERGGGSSGTLYDLVFLALLSADGFVKRKTVKVSIRTLAVQTIFVNIQPTVAADVPSLRVPTRRSGSHGSPIPFYLACPLPHSSPYLLVRNSCRGFDCSNKDNLHVC